MSFAWHEIRDHLMQSSSTLHFQRSFDAILRAQPALAPFEDPAALLDRLHRGPGDPDRKNLILSALAETARVDGPSSDCALTLLLLALWPGLDAIRRRSIWRRIGTADEVTSDVLARATTAIRGLDPGQVNRIAATILRNIERDMIRARRCEVLWAHEITDVEPDTCADNGSEIPGPVSQQLLRRDLIALIGIDAALVIRVAIHGFTQAEAASDLGIPMEAARKRYQRAIRRLREALQEKF